MGTIRITPEELRDAASVIKQKQDSISGEVQALKSKISQTAEAWEGAARSSFIETFETTFLPMLEKDFPDILQGIQAQLNGAADTLETADAEIAKGFRA